MHVGRTVGGPKYVSAVEANGKFLKRAMTPMNVSIMLVSQSRVASTATDNAREHVRVGDGHHMGPAMIQMFNARMAPLIKSTVV